MQSRITINIGESASSAQLRRLIRDRHAAWSQETFGDVGPVGPLKHLAKEALEAAAAPDDLSEWADLQFLLWDAQRRAGISDGEITAAMEEKLKVNMARQWPEPKDGEPRLHIKEFGNSPVIPDGWESCKHLLPIGELIHRLEEQTGEKWIYAKDAIPDGYVMVPIEPTEDMIVYGFESEPDEDFSDPAVWEEYQAMSGCQQAAHRAKLCWAAMIAAAPKPGDSNG
ncbi:dATP/dGTP pyrophosphohydrolase domain-containing protein [Enterobacter hormaechei]|uniref:dATP/dGTP pyrophosphohydrolase domain-containing protein n=1 Tax=Enterobacter hormaechei TaxID=158836 RepID=UPI003A9203CF